MAWTFVSLHAIKPARSRGRRRHAIAHAQLRKHVARDARNLISTQVSPELSPFAVEANAQKLVTLLAVLGFSIDSVAERRGNKLLVTFIGAANCWGLRSLSQGNPLARPPLVNDFGAKVVGCVKIKILRHARRAACSMAWRCRFLTARRGQHGRVIAEK